MCFLVPSLSCCLQQHPPGSGGGFSSQFICSSSRCTGYQVLLHSPAGTVSWLVMAEYGRVFCDVQLDGQGKAL